MGDSVTATPETKVIYFSEEAARRAGRLRLITQDDLIELNALRSVISRVRRDSQLGKLETRAEKLTRSLKKKIRQQWEVEDGLWRPRLVEQPRGASAASRLYIEMI